jgi:plasmid stabilization system protein ParE
MNKRWEIIEEAEEDVEDAFRWYRRTRRLLGDEFLHEYRVAAGALERGEGVITADPSEGPDGKVFRCRLKRFPYAIVFVELDDCFKIVAVFHLRRRPGAWRLRLV